MKAIAATLILLLSGFVTNKQDCKCSPPKPNETTYQGGNELVIYKEDEVLRVVRGVVLQPDLNPMENALVELFSPPSHKLYDYYHPVRGKIKESKRVAACKTGADGIFCFGRIPRGQYELRVSKDEFSAWNPTHVFIQVNPRSQRAVNKTVEVIMKLGT
ncbi:MAG: carboxypeptidase-like regulatory domain-containing protein [Blastocatellia bacterium]